MLSRARIHGAAAARHATVALLRSSRIIAPVARIFSTGAPADGADAPDRGSPARPEILRQQRYEPTHAPERSATEIIAEIKAQREAEAAENPAGTQIKRSPMREEDDMYDETDPLSADMFAREPVEHKATLIWLVGLGDTHENARTPFEFTEMPNVRLVIPNPAKIPVTALDDYLERSWFDVFAPEYAEGLHEDKKGLARSTKRLHELVDAESDRLGLLHPPDARAVLPRRLNRTDVRAAGARRVFVGGFGQGGALAISGALDYPLPLAGVVSFAGFPPSVKELTRRVEAAVAAHATPTAVAADAAGDAAVAAAAASAAAAFGEEGPAVGPAPNTAAPVLVVHGGADAAVPWDDYAEPRWEALKKSVVGMRGFKPTVRFSPPLGHWLGTNELMDVQSWMQDRIRDFETKNVGGK